MHLDELRHRFTYHPPREGQPAQYEAIRDAGLRFALVVNELVPETLEQMEALKRIEEAVMWANAGIARFG